MLLHELSGLKDGIPTKGEVNPPFHYVYFNFRILEVMAKGRLTRDLYKQILGESEALEKTIREMS